ncbi:MAG: HIT domain-containing protein [Ilumatobacteraceae bacterium]
MIERIWSGWRSTYVTAAPVRSAPEASRSDPGAAGSVFTRILNSGASDADTHIVHRSTTCFVICNLFPYTIGHVLVVPFREVADLEQLTDDETSDLWSTVTRTVAVVRDVYRPDGLNVGLNLGRPAGGSVPDHLHVHVVPRWTGDSNFMMAVSNTQNLPESIDVTAAKLTAAWAVA